MAEDEYSAVSAEYSLLQQEIFSERCGRTMHQEWTLKQNHAERLDVHIGGMLMVVNLDELTVRTCLIVNLFTIRHSQQNENALRL